MKIIFLGQDPYPNRHHANGLAFSIPDNRKVGVPYSLDVMIDELSKYTHSPALGVHKKFPFNYTLSHWVEQGVLLLNTALSVKEGNPGSHRLEWEKTGIIKDTMIFLNEIERPLIFVFIGGIARKYNKYITSDHHYILNFNHPAAGKYNKGLNFVGNDFYKKIDDVYEKIHKSKMKWV